MWLEVDEREVRLMDVHDQVAEGWIAPVGVEEVPYLPTEPVEHVVARHERTHTDEWDAVKAAVMQFQRDDEVAPQRWETFGPVLEHGPAVWAPAGQARGLGQPVQSLNMVRESQVEQSGVRGKVQRVTAEVKATVTAKRVRSEHQRDVRRYRAGARHPNGRGL